MNPVFICLRRVFESLQPGVRGPLLFLAMAAACYGQHSVTLNWTDPTNPAGTNYNVYKLTGVCPGLNPPLSDFAKVNATPIPAFTYLDLAVTAGTTYCYVLTAITAAGTNESGPSKDAGATIPVVSPPVQGSPKIADDDQPPQISQIQATIPADGSPE